MSSEVVLRSITPKQQGALQNKIRESEEFEIQKTGHVDVRRRAKIPDFPRCHGYFRNVGYVGNNNGPVSAVLTNTDLKELKPYHDKLRKIYKSVESFGINLELVN